MGKAESGILRRAMRDLEAEEEYVNWRKEEHDVIKEGKKQSPHDPDTAPNNVPVVYRKVTNLQARTCTDQLIGIALDKHAVQPSGRWTNIYKAFMFLGELLFLFQIMRIHFGGIKPFKILNFRLNFL